MPTSMKYIDVQARYQVKKSECARSTNGLVVKKKKFLEREYDSKSMRN